MGAGTTCYGAYSLESEFSIGLFINFGGGELSVTVTLQQGLNRSIEPRNSDWNWIGGVREFSLEIFSYICFSY